MFKQTLSDLLSDAIAELEEVRRVPKYAAHKELLDRCRIAMDETRALFDDLWAVPVGSIVPFEEVANGQRFIFDDDVWQKLDCASAVHLETEIPHKFYPDYVVEVA
jgi:hypothetical protein